MRKQILGFLTVLALTIPAVAGNATSVHYYRHVAFNHNTPYLAYTGTNEIDAEQAKTVEHYAFVLDGRSRVVEIRNDSSEVWHHHPLTHLGAYRTTIAYEGNKEIHRFYDRAGNQVRNLRNVYEEVYALDSAGNRVGLEFFDLQHRPMESNWGVARYAWERTGNVAIERRYDLTGALVPVAQHFRFHISRFTLGADGYVAEHCNLDDRLEVVASPEAGVACYRDTRAANGNFLGVTYYDRDGRVTNSPWTFAVVRLTYDKDGNVIAEDRTDKNGLSVSHETFAYDASGGLIAQKK